MRTRKGCFSLVHAQAITGITWRDLDKGTPAVFVSPRDLPGPSQLLHCISFYPVLLQNRLVFFVSPQQHVVVGQRSDHLARILSLWAFLAREGQQAVGLALFRFE